MISFQHGPAPGWYVVRWQDYSLLMAGKRLLCIGGLILALLGLILVALLAGETWLAPAEIFAKDLAPAKALLLWEFRLPRILLAIVAGLALGCAGYLLQILTHNPLATPDMLGLADGALLLVFLSLIASSDGSLGPWWVGPLGALFALGLLMLFAAGRIHARALNLLILGLACGNLLRALSEMVLARQELMHAAALYSFASGSLNGRGMDALWPLACGVALLLPAVLLATRHLNLLRLHPQHAQSLGLPLYAVQALALLAAVGLAGLSVGICGPLAFVALAAPFIAQRLPQSGGALASGLLGALLLLLADTLARCLPGQLPTGVVCNLAGGPFLLWLLARSPGENR